MSYEGSNEYLFLKTGDELASGLNDKVSTFQEHAIRAGMFKNWTKNKRYYENNFYGYNVEDILDSGDEGELKATSHNQFRNILRHMINTVVTAPVSFDVSAANTDVSSRRAAKVSKNLVNSYYKVKRVSKVFAAAAEKSQVYGDSYILCEWNPFIGKPIAKGPDGKMIYEGDFNFCALSPFDVFFDISKAGKSEWEWVIFRTRRNKYDLAEQFESRREDIIKCQNFLDSDAYYLRDFLRAMYAVDSDDIYVYSLYYKANNVLPNGKYCLFTGDNNNHIMLYEGDNIYEDKIPLFPLSPSDYLENSFGFSEANSLRGPQEFINLMVSAWATNLAATSVVNFWTADPTVEVEQVTDGMNFIKSAQEPKVLNMAPDSTAIQNAINVNVATMETLSGQNSVARGNVQSAPNLKSGVALATVLQMAQQYSSSYITSFYDCCEDVFTFVLDFLEKHANTQRIYEIAGKSNQSAINTFTKSDLKGKGRVIVDRSNPILKMPAGQIEIANNLLQAGLINARQYLDVINNGNLNVATEADDRLNDYIANAKERLLRGESLQAIPGIDHQAFLKEIHSLLCDIDIVNKPENKQIQANILNLVQQHLTIARNGDELAEFIFHGALPTPPQISQSEIQNMATPPDMANQDVMQRGIAPQPQAGPMPPIQ